MPRVMKFDYGFREGDKVKIETVNEDTRAHIFEESGKIDRKQVKQCKKRIGQIGIVNTIDDEYIFVTFPDQEELVFDPYELSIAEDEEEVAPIQKSDSEEELDPLTKKCAFVGRMSGNNAQQTHMLRCVLGEILGR